ncbi:DNA-binding transcriptional activator of the SARP family [Lentzea xinjiangensis]|uniref:DNA-binding transcriptional activator of the SARP family n=2 Tax=Lentzea xinjiangensis TaxID=402600 RepID=A0A1H9UH77_9PSEU|nr:DNA-binding transcriptional activator of the SARP family [Lentzea xinjiangensis]
MLGPMLIKVGNRGAMSPGRLQSTLLGVLLYHANQPVSVDALTETMWGDRRDPRAGQKLQLHVHRLRNVFAEADRLTLGPAGYRLTVLDGELDAQRFASRLEEAREVAAEEPKVAVTLLRSALELWRGEPLGDVDVPVLTDWAHRLAELKLTALEALYEAELACDPNVAVTGELAELVRQHPLRERLHGLLMIALSRAGRQAEALQAYRTARDTLVDELGLEPGPQLRELHRRMLAGDAFEPSAGGGAATAPAQLPMDVLGFVGREAELEELDGLLVTEPGAVITAVAGTAGVGKTALAVRWAHRARERFPGGQLYVDLRGYGPEQPVTPEDALAGFLRALGLDGAAIPHDLDERAARFRSLTARSRMLVVLDNARTVEQVRPLLPGGSSCFVVVTSRNALAGLVAREGAHRLHLERLPNEDAHLLLQMLLDDRVDAEPEAARELVRRCARLPLALRIAAELVRSRPGRGLGRFADELAAQQAVLDVLDIDGDPHTAVRAVFSWSYRQLDPGTARTFRLLGLHPGHDVDEYATAALAGAGLRDTRRALQALRRAHLIDSSSDGRFRLHDLLRAYAAELAASTDSAAEREAALDRLVGCYLFTASKAMDVIARDDYARRPEPPRFDGETPSFTTYEHAWQWLDDERTNLVEISRHGGPAAVIHLSQTIWRYLDTGGYNDDAMTLHTRELDATRALGDECAEAKARRVLGATLSRLGCDGDAMGHLEWALAAFRRTGERAFEVATLSFLGCVYSKKGELDEGGRWFEQALTLTDADDGWYLHCAVTINHSRNLVALGRADEALSHLLTIIPLCRQKGAKHLECNALLCLSRVDLHAGRLDSASDHVQLGLTLAREAGFRTLESDALRMLGVVHVRRGNHEQALRLHKEATELARVVGDTELIAENLNSLAAAQAAAGLLLHALDHYGNALAVATDAGHRQEQASAHAGIGDVHDRLGEHGKAGEHWLRVLALYRGRNLLGAREAQEKLLHRGTTRAVRGR